MQLKKRQARARARAKSLRIRRGFKGRASTEGDALTPSKWGYDPFWRHRRHDGLTPGEVQSIRKLARRDAVPT